ncbi:MAG: NADH-quinone oxidoreductase subunit F [Deltaproteobacteria bacterium]|nr:NADH-quinone oxidoreductase subunit F [Deltaproteobacteria bacterium]
MVNPILLIAVPLAFAFSIPLFGLISKRAGRFIPPVAMLFNLVLSIILIPDVLESPVSVFLSGFPPPFGINLYVGPLGILFSAVIALVGFLVSIYALDYIKEGAEEKYHMLYLALLTGATGVVLTGDIFNLFVFFEILCISSYGLVGYLGNKAGVESAVKYLIQGSVGSAFNLIGIALIYGQFGTLNMADIAANINSVSPNQLFIPLVLFIVGFGIEGAIFPLNAWLPDAHSSAPSTISAVLSGIAIETGVYAIARVTFTIFGASDILLFLVLLGLLTLLAGELSAFSQNNIKRMLAYSSIGQMGLILFALGIGTDYGIAGGLFQFINHALSKALIFLATGYMIYRMGSMEISSLEGIGKKMPVSSLCFTVGAFSLIGLPPFAGFPSKFMIVLSALEKHSNLFIVFIGIVFLGTVIEATYFFKVIQVLYFKGAPAGVPAEKKTEISPAQETIKDRGVITGAPIAALIPMIILALLIILIGVYPKAVDEILNASSIELLDRVKYIQGVLR